MYPCSTEIVLHAVRTEKKSRGKNYQHAELYRVNLDTRKIWKCPGGKLNFDNGLNSMATSGDAIYAIGGNLLSEEDEYVKGRKHLHSSASYINLVNDDAQWKPLRDFRDRYPILSCATFKGNLFVFGGNFEELVVNTIGEELCLTSEPPSSRHFLPTPPLPPSEINVIRRRSINIVSTPTLVDSKNNRILVHHARISSLYAYYPDERKWDFLFCIEWHKLVGVFDDMILFHFPGYFEAYDLQTGTKLDKPFVSTKFPSNLLYRKFEALIPLSPPGIFCLAAYSPDFGVPDLTHLIFAKFRLMRSPSGKPRIIFLSSYNLDLDCKVCVTHYAPIDVVVSSKKDNVADSSKRGNSVSSEKGNVVFSSKISSWESARGITFGTICF